jgi:hypothetical protein
MLPLSLRRALEVIMSKARADWRRHQVVDDAQQKRLHSRRVGGWKAKKSGESAEDLVEQMGRLYLEEGRAELRKRPEPYRRIGAAKANGHFTAAPLSKSGPDFDLALPDGRAGLLELKTRKGKRIPLRAVGDVQAAALKRRVEWRGFGAVIICLWDEGVPARWWVIDWRRWEQATKHGYKSLSDQDLDRVATPCSLGYALRPDWLPALLQAHEEASQRPWVDA